MPVLFESPDTNMSLPPEPPSVSEAVATKTMGLFSHFMQKPDDVQFESQQEGEVADLVLRPHIVTNVPWIIISFVLILCPWILWPLVFTFKALPFAIPFGYPIVLTLFWYVVVAGFSLTSFLHWYYNIYIVTSQRIVDIDFIQLLYRRFSSAQLSRIQDVTYTQSGFARTLFDYGDVFIQTAGSDSNFDFEDVAHPQKVVDTIALLCKQYGIELKKKQP